jgi:hypothetical protein
MCLNKCIEKSVYTRICQNHYPNKVEEARI